MAHILPDVLPQSIPSEVHRTFRALKNLPNDFYIWHHLAPWEPDTPDFLMITKEGKVLLIKVSGSTTAQTSIAAQMLLIPEEERPPLGVAESVMFSSFKIKLDLPANYPLETLVIFPNISHKHILESRLKREEGEPQWVGKEILQSDSNINWLDFLLPEIPDPRSLEKIRQIFTPEVVVPEDMTVRMSDPRRLKAGLTNYLLDYDQEKAVKLDLALETDGQNLGSDFRLNIINGVAGSGKTLILLYRLRLLYQFYPDKRYLVLTHNRPLRFDLESRFERLEGKKANNITWNTFFGWCKTQLNSSTTAGGWKDPLPLKKRVELIRKAWQTTLKGSSINEYMLQGEIDWVKDQLPMNEIEYLNVDRRGRGFGLTAEQRKRMWIAMQMYQNLLQDAKNCDWGDVPQQIWHLSRSGDISLPQYDVVLIDEAQFFAPIWINLIQSVLKPQNPHLFLVADPTQGFLGRKTSWKSLGLDARGRTYKLKHSYRTTHEILQFATLFYRLRLDEEKDEDILAPDLLNMPNGVVPQIIPLDSAQDEIARVANEVENFLSNGCPRRDLLLLHANGNGVDALIKAINQRNTRSTAMDPKDTYPGNYVRVTTLNAGAGLESPIVFLVGLRELFEQEQSLRLSDEEREEVIRDNTRKIYMAATRAGQRLVFTYVGDLPELLQQVIKIQSGK
ncbi:MAG: hypothetical protein CL609_24185 [Anaerolineaceae bacterium]|nr:hypothetical protein [Anaerolineaceae bacterium]